MKSTTTDLFFCMVSAHLLGDFVFQTSEIAEKKKKNLKFLFLHALIQALVVWIVCGLWTNWKIPLYIFTTHFVIDFIKIKLNDERVGVFIVDQVLHVITILLFVNSVFHEEISASYWVQVFGDTYFIYQILLSGLILSSKAGESIIPYFLEKNKIIRPGESESMMGFPAGGRLIGILERLMIFMFIYLDATRDIAFLITAKSILRFGEVTDNAGRKNAEYIIIGTFLSFAYAIFIAAITMEIINHY